MNINNIDVNSELNKGFDDYNNKILNSYEFFKVAAKKSRYDYSLWVRYLNKVIQRDKFLISNIDVEIACKIVDFTSFQKSFLKAAMIKGSEPWNLVVSLSEKETEFSSTERVLKNLGWL